ncbi:filamin-A isoform X2 [Colossoma macropomum]|uniref:filamin-A isoform X2 n=1 Tax=Colossoma macropomum TaxID=42526 RepID=UPI001864C768|nr:filamin-A isoform X2 [Colossoma macropomum]
MSDFVNSVTAAQINLSDDAPWKKIQKNTFTRWCNEHLRCVDKQINDLRFDLSDGLNLISLLEVLSHKRMFRKFHARPTLRQLKLDNVSVALEFLDREKIKLVSIDSKAIVDGNLKLILGLVWTLILHYSISIPVWEDEASDTVTKLTPEMRLLGWIQSKVPELPITNFSQDWQDGKALGALVDGLAPGLCPDWESWEAVQRVTNTREAMQQADDWLGVPQLIAPEEILDPGVDERSVMTYLSLFPKAKLKPGAPLKPKTVPKPKACRATGRGLQARGLRVGQLADFKVDTHKAGPGSLAVHIREPTGNEVAVKQREVLEGIYDFEYMPGDEGDYTVDITWANKHIPKSPFKVHVGPKAGQQKIRAWGPGLEGGTVGMPASFLVEATGVEAGMLGFAIEGPSQAKIECDDKNAGSCFVRFWPTEAGEYAVHVMCDDEEIEDSPFMACIAPKRKSFSPEKVKVYGAGVSPAGLLVNCQAEFTVDATQAGEGVLKIFIQTLEGSSINVDVICEEAGIYNCSYTPTTICKHTIVVSWGGVSVPGSPFTVMPGKIKIEPYAGSWSRPHGSEINYLDEEMDTDQVTEVNMKAGNGSRLDIDVVSPLDLPTSATKVKAYGPGLRGGLLGQRAEFTIDTRAAGSGRLTVTVEGPCQVTLQCMDNEDGTCAVFYLPAENGEYTIRIFFANSQIPGSPFLPVVHLPLDPSKVTVSGPGLTKGKVGEPCMVNIDCALAGSGDLSVEAVSDSGAIAKTEVLENEDGSYTVVYVPLTAGVYTLLLKYGGQVVPNFPAEIVVDPAVYKSHVKLTGQGDLANAAGFCKPSQVLADGLGLLQGLAGHPNMCYINTRGAGNGHLEVTVEGPSESKVSCKDNEDGSYTMEYIPSTAGQYDVNITYGGKSIPGSPFKVTVKDVSGTSAEIFGPGICAQSSQNFTFDSKKTGNIPETVTVITPQGKSELMDLKDNGDGTYTVNYSPSVEGPHSLMVKYAGDDSYCSPVNFHVLQRPAAGGEKAKNQGPRREMNISGEGLESGICAKTPQSFTIGCSATGKAPETVAIAKPDGTVEVLELTDNGDGTYTVTCSPTTGGSHLLAVKYTDEEAFSSPYEFHVLDAECALQSIVTAPGLVSGICTQTPQVFTIDCREHGKLPTSIAMMNPKGLIELLGVKDNGDGTYTVSYSPSVEGPHSLMVKYGDNTAFSSPFKFQVLPKHDGSFAQDCRSKTEINGPGLEGKYCARTPQNFTIGCSSTGAAPETVVIVNPDDSVDLGEVTDNGDGTYSVVYCPSIDGPHSVVVKYADEDAFSSAFKFHVLPTDDMTNVKISAKGVESGICTQRFAPTGKVPQSLAAITPKGVTEMMVAESSGDETYVVSYLPTTADPHSSMVRYAEDDSNSSPCNFQVLPTPDASENEMSRKENISGQDMAGIHAGVPQKLVIGCSDKGEAPEMVALVKPDGTFDLVKVTDNADGTYTVHCTPSVEGLNSLFVKYANEEPFRRSARFEVLPAKAESKVKFSGTGMKSGICTQAPQTFTIDCSTTGETVKSVAIVTPNGKTELVEVKDNGDGTYTVNYSPSVEGPHSIMVKYAEDESFSRPFKFQVLPVLVTGDQNIPVQDLKVSGQELMGAVYQNIPQTFTIDCNNTGEAPEIAVVVKPDGTIDLLGVHDNGDGTCSAAYAPSMEGSYSFVLKYAREESFCRPFGFQVLPTEETPIKVTGPGLESGIRAQQPQMFTIDCSLTGVPEAVAIICPNGTTEMLQAKDNGDGTYSVSFFPSMEGPHGLLVKTAGEDKYCNPLGFQVLPAEVVKEVKVSGPGLDSGICSQSPQTFKIDCRKTGDTPQVISMLTPYGLMEQLEVKNNGDGTYIVNYSPSVDGFHSLMVKYAADDSYCSPFRFYVLPSTNADTDHDLVEELKKKTGISGPGLESGICARTPQTFTVDCSSTGEAPETVAVVKPDGTVKLVDISDNGDGTYSVAYSPGVEGSYFLMVKYTDEDAFRSPYEFQVIPRDDKEETKIYGLGLESGICSQVPQTFRINSSETGKPPETVVMMTPNGKTELVDIKDNGDGTYTVNYSPSVEGPHSLMVKYADDESFISSLKFHVLPTNKQKGGNEEQRDTVEISDQKLNTGIHIEMPHTFALKCSSTGAAPETAAVVKPDGTIDLLKVLDNADGTYHMTYTPSEEGAHSLVVRYAGEEAFCSSTEFNVLPQHDLTTETALDSKVLGREITPLGFTNQAGLMMFDMVMQLGEGEISGEVIMPSGMTAQLDIIGNGDGTITLKFSPTEEGLHHILIKSPAEIPEFSLQYYVNSSMNRSMKAHGRGLVYGVTHETAAFTIYHEDTAIGELDITVEGTSESEVCCFDNKDGTCTVTYLPTQPGDYKIQVRHNDMHISGSPFKAKITDGSLRKSQVKLGPAVDFALDITEEDISLLTTSISSPTRQDVPCSLKRQPDSHIGISFIPREVGEHLVSIKKDGKHVRRSPIPVCISQSDIGDASKVKVFGLGLHSGRTNHISEFVVNTRDAGYGGLTVAIEGPTNVVIHTEELEGGACRISYCPSKPGTYKVSIRFSDEHIPGSPFLAEVTDGELMRQSITHYQKPPSTASIGKECSLTFKISGIDVESMSAKVSAPSGMAAEAMVAATHRDTYAVSFVPEEMGVHSVSMKSHGQEIEGSSLQYTVGPLGEGGAAKVQTWGQGLHRAHAKIPADFNIWAREAGEGSLCVSVEGPGHTELHLDDHKDGSCSVSYTVEEPGDYQVSILFNEEHISASPFLVSVSSLTEDGENSLEGLETTDHELMSNGCAESSQPGSSLNSTCTCSAESVLLSNVSEITSHGPGLSEASIGQKNTFYVDCSKAGRNMLFVGMLGPTVPCERVTVRHLGKNQYSINYTVKERGKYVLAVKWGDEHIPGSPFHINVL